MYRRSRRPRSARNLELVEQAIEVMRQTVSGPRADRKASPSEGAVLRKPDGAVETACQGELRVQDAEGPAARRPETHIAGFEPPGHEMLGYM